MWAAAGSQSRGVLAVPWHRNGNLPGQEGAEERKTGQPYLRAMKSSAKPLHTSANLLTPLPDRLPMLREAATTVKMQSMLATHQIRQDNIAYSTSSPFVCGGGKCRKVALPFVPSSHKIRG